MKQTSCCGAVCAECKCYEILCKGCSESKGEVFHTPKGEACPIYVCAVHKKKVKNCGECRLVPCVLWRDTRDPQLSDEEFQNSIQVRRANLKNVKDA